jgi:hypothetical protein
MLLLPTKKMNPQKILLKVKVMVMNNQTNQKIKDVDWKRA